MPTVTASYEFASSTSGTFNVTNVPAGATKIISVTVNNGNVTSWNWNADKTITVSVSGMSSSRYEYYPGGYTATRQEDFMVGFSSPPYNTCQTSVKYEDYFNDGYTGTMNLKSGSCIYDPGGGTGSGGYTGRYSGTVSKWIDTSYYVYYYGGTVTVTYETKTQIATFKIKLASSILVLPVYDPNIGMTGKNQLRINTSKGVGCFELVPINDANASPIRVYTSGGIKAISK